MKFKIMEIEGCEDEYVRTKIDRIEFFIILEKFVKIQVKGKDAQDLIDILNSHEIYLINPSVDEDIWSNGDIVLNFEIDAISVNKFMGTLMESLNESLNDSEKVYELLRKVL